MLGRKERHRTARTGWLRAAVLGANDGILSTRAWYWASPPLMAGRVTFWLPA